MKIPNLIDKLKEIQKEREARPRQHTLSFGEQDPMDMISYAGMEEQPDHLIIDGQFHRTIFISVSGYPSQGLIGWLDALTRGNRNINVSYHIAPVDSNDAMKSLRTKITEFESKKLEKAQSGRIIGPEITAPLQSAVELQNAILSGEQKLFNVSISATLTADSLEELNNITDSLEASMNARLFYIKTALFQQPEGLQSTLPRGENILDQRRNLNSDTAALTFPFVSAELMQPDGVLFGVNHSNNSLVIIDRFSLHNANSIMFAVSGSGKSYAMKVEVSRQLMAGTKVIIIDPEREYENLTKSLGGTYIKLSARSEQKINPFDTATTSRDKKELAAHVRDLTGVITVLVNGISDSEKAVLDKAILKVYEKITSRQPTLDDLYKELKRRKVTSLCEQLDQYITGSMAGVFNCQTNVELDNRLIVFDIKDMPEDSRRIMMMIVANFVQNTVMQKPEKRILVIDEAWSLIQHEETARFIDGLVRRARKYYLGVALITQQVNDFLGNKYGRTIASQSSLRMMLRLDTTTIQQVTNAFQLSDFEKNYLLTCERGDVLILADRQHVAARVTASDEEHPLITTNPLETLAKKHDD